MDNREWDKVVFVDHIHDFDMAKQAGRVVHVLCLEGGMSFFMQGIRYNIVPGDYVILTNLDIVSGLTASSDCRALTMALSESYVLSMAIRSNYGVIGHLSLLQNPVMKLSERDFDKCRADMLRIGERLGDRQHMFFDEMIAHLLMAHIMDLYDIHARGRQSTAVSERAAGLMRRFIEMLFDGEYISHRDVPHYASRLCITPHYLSEICKKTSGRPASYWIDRFTLHEITNLLHQKQLSLSEIASRMNFSSVSYFSRYVQSHTGVYPTEYRNLLAGGGR